MTDLAETLTAEWSVSMRPVGELLAAEARIGFLRAVLYYGGPDGGRAGSTQRRLEDLIEEAGLALRGTDTSEIPPALRRAALDLVGWRAEDFSRQARELSAIVFFASPRGVGFTHVGGTEPRVWIDGRFLHVPWSAVRDADGREARVFFRSAGRCQRIELEWSPLPDAPGITAYWSAADASEDRPGRGDAIEATVEAANETDETPPTNAAHEVPSYASGRFFKWLDRVVQQQRSERSSPAEPEAAAPAVPEPPWTAIPVPPPEPKPAQAADEAATLPAWAHAPHAGAVPAAPAPAPRVAPSPARASAPVAPVPAPVAAPKSRDAAPIGSTPAATAPSRIETPRPHAAPPAPVAPPTRATSPAAPGIAWPASEPRPEVEPPRAEFAPTGEPVAVAPMAEAGRVREVRRPSWPAPEDLESPGRRRRFLPTAIVVALLFAAGWLLGRAQPERVPAGTSFANTVLRRMGLGGPRYDCAVKSWPAGASIAVDGKEVGRRTPTTLELKPGPHQITLSFPSLGAATFTVKGEHGDKASLEAPLFGALDVRAEEGRDKIMVLVDGEARGFAPIEIRRLTPGTHQVEFSKPGLPAWGQTIEVRVNQTTEVGARVLESPANGIIDVKAAVANDPSGEELDGATVWVDGARRGLTPLTVELPKGPHSIRAEYRGEEAPVQLIDLPGGNQRFATFLFGTGAERARLVLLSAPGAMSRDQPSVVSATLEEMHAGEVREMWMHVRTPEGPWRRYPMTVMNGPGGAVGAVVFPLSMIGDDGRTPYYVSATTLVGDEFFTELQNSGH